MSPAQAREERAQLVDAESRFAAMYEELTTATLALDAQTAAYRRALERARALGLDSSLTQSLQNGMAQAEQVGSDYAAAAQGAVGNARLVSDLIPELDAAIRAAEAGALLRRSAVRVSAQTLATALSDLRQLRSALGTYLVTGMWPGSEPSAEAQAISPLRLVLPLAVVVALGVSLFAGFRRIRGHLLDGLATRLAEAPQGQRDLRVWRHARGIDLLQAVLVFAFLAGSLQALPVATAGSLALTGLIFAWCAYAATRSLLRLVLAPTEEGLGLLACDQATSRRVVRIVSVMLLYSAVMLPLVYALSLFDYPHRDVRLALKLVYGLGTVTLLLWLMNSRRGPLALLGRGQVGGRCEAPRWTSSLNLAVSLVAVALLVMVAMGYANLSSYLARSLLLTGLLAAVVWPLYARLSRELAARFPVATGEQTGILQRPWMQQALRATFLLLVVLLLLKVWGVQRYHLDSLIAYASQPVLDVRGAKVSLLAIAEACLVLLASLGIAGFTRRRVLESPTLSQRWDHGTRHAIGSFLYYGFLASGFVLAVLVAGLQLNVLTAFAGMFGIAIGFGSQDIAKNTICGLIIMLDRSINAGDYVDVAGQSGTIVDISVRSTTIRTQDNRLVVVPNSVFYTQNVIVSSQRDRRVRLTVDVAVAPETDFNEVATILADVAQAQDGILGHPPPEVLFTKLAGNALNLQLVAWTDHIDGLPNVQGRLLKSVWLSLKAHGVSVV